jgi:tetratricopeptide (TPR) repeat protein
MNRIICLLLVFSYNTAHCQLADSTKIKEMMAKELAFEDQNVLDSALAESKKIVNMAPTCYPVMNTIAGLYGKLGDFNSEVEWAKKALHVHFGYAEAYINLGNGYLGLNDLVNAKENYTEAEKLDPKNPIPVYSLGVIEENKQNYQQALVYYKQSVALDSNYENGFYNMAAMYANLGDFKNAEICIEKVLKLDPGAEDAKEMQAHIKPHLQ